MRNFTTLGSLLLASALLSMAHAAPLTLRLNIMNGDKPFTGQLTTSGGQMIQTTMWQMYISNVSLVKADGSEVKVKGMNLVKLGEKGPFQNILAFKADVVPGKYRGLRFDVGLPRDLNHIDASTQKAPLGVDSGMFWAWNPGYIFSRYEGKAKVGNQTLEVALHVGEDRRRMNVDLADMMKPGTIVNVTAKGAQVAVKLDAQKMVAAGVNGGKFDLADNQYVQVHGGAVADQLYLNLAGAFSLMKAGSAASGMTMKMDASKK